MNLIDNNLGEDLNWKDKSKMDISEPKSRTFNMYLRYFQMGLQIIIASKLS